MLAFTQIPASYAPLGGAVNYTVTSDAPATIELRIRRRDPAIPGALQLLGAKRYVGVTSAVCDVAPLLRRCFQFTPTTPGTGLRTAANRTAILVVEARIAGREESAVAAPERTFVPWTTALRIPALLTTMPRQRLLAPGEHDELTLLAAAPLTVEVTASAHGEERVARYELPAAGLHLFRVEASDFAGAEQVTVDAGSCGTVRYTLLPNPEGSCRLAWRTTAGSVDSYTFPVEREVRLCASKRRCYGREGYAAATVAAEERIVVESACEEGAVAAALAGLVTAPQVWRVEGTRYTPVDVVSDEAVVRRYGVLEAVQLEIRSTLKTPLAWN